MIWSTTSRRRPSEKFGTHSTSWAMRSTLLEHFANPCGVDMDHLIDKVQEVAIAPVREHDERPLPAASDHGREPTHVSASGSKGNHPPIEMRFHRVTRADRHLRATPTPFVDAHAALVEMVGAQEELCAHGALRQFSSHLSL